MAKGNPDVSSFLRRHALRGAWMHASHVLSDAQSRATAIIAILSLLGGAAVATWTEGVFARAIGVGFGGAVVVAWWALAALRSAEDEARQLDSELRNAATELEATRRERDALQVGRDHRDRIRRAAHRYTERIQEMADSLIARWNSTDKVGPVAYVDFAEFVRAASPTRFAELLEVERDRRHKNQTLPVLMVDQDVARTFRDRGGGRPPDDLDPDAVLGP